MTTWEEEEEEETFGVIHLKINESLIFQQGYIKIYMFRSWQSKLYIFQQEFIRLEAFETSLWEGSDLENWRMHF